MCEIDLIELNYLHAVRVQAAIKSRDEEEGSNARSAASTVVPQEDADEVVGTTVANDASPAVATAPTSIPQVASTAQVVFLLTVSGRLLMFVFGCIGRGYPHRCLSSAFFLRARKGEFWSRMPRQVLVVVYASLSY